MRTIGTIEGVDGPLGFVRGITRYQWLVFFVAWAGWSLDATDFGLFSLVLRPALTELLGGNPSIADIGRVGGILSTVGLLGWSIGGFTFGIVADYIGRVRTLALSILIYSVFTGLQGLAHSPLELGIYPLLRRSRHRSGDHCGHSAGGGSICRNASRQDPRDHDDRRRDGQHHRRAGLCANRRLRLALCILRRRRPGAAAPADPPQHDRTRTLCRGARAAAHTGRGRTVTAEDREFLRFVPLQLFNRQLRFSTLVGLLFALGTLLAIWTTVIWLPTIQSLMLEKEGIKGAAAAPIIGRNMMLWGIGGIFGYASFGFIADLIGRRPTVALYNIGTLVLGLTLFLAVDSMAPYPYLLVIYGFFVLGVFSGHAVYIPELFPTHVRATAVSFCNGTARVITSFGPLVAGLLAAPFGGNFNKPAAIMTCFALLSIYAMYLGRETRSDPLPL